jgi:hypothetical protein
MKEEGAPGYVDEATGQQLRLTLFGEADEIAKQLRAGTAIRVAAAGVDRKPTAPAITGKVTVATQSGRLCKVTLAVDSPATAFQPAGLARLWIAE